MATTRKKASAEKITLVPLTDLYERADHPIKMRDDDSMQETIESVKRSGVLTPGTVRPRAEGGYRMGARRTGQTSSGALLFENRHFSQVKSRRKSPKNTPIA